MSSSFCCPSTNPNLYPFASQPGLPAQPLSPADNPTVAPQPPAIRKHACAASDVGDGAPAGAANQPSPPCSRSHSSHPDLFTTKMAQTCPRALMIVVASPAGRQADTRSKSSSSRKCSHGPQTHYL
ncbi:hypothetical protein K439DRAFT_1068691 [Ramaria rubella]|nr:hypothetical protein K439DRAFT_1068691 [Ramaria rubella]